MHWVETLTDEGKLRQMYRFARNGGENNEKASWRVNAKLSGMGFMSSSISPSPSCPSPLRLPPVFLSFPFSHPLHHVSYLSVSPKHVLMSPSISSWTWPSSSILVPSLAYTSSIPVLLIYTTPLVSFLYTISIRVIYLSTALLHFIRHSSSNFSSSPLSPLPFLPISSQPLPSLLLCQVPCPMTSR